MYKIVRALVAAVLVVASVAPALPQSYPSWLRQGYVPTAAQWQKAFTDKQDLLSYTPVNRAGDTMQGIFRTFPNSANLSGFVVAVSPAAPATPQEGALWVTTAGLYLYVNGATVGPFAAFSSSTGTGDVVRQTSPTITGLTVTGSLTATGLITNADLATMAAWTLKGNVTGSTASPTNFTIGGLTHKASPASTDLFMLQDQAASGAYKYCTIAECLSAVSAGVTSVNSQAGALTMQNGIVNSSTTFSLDTTYPTMGMWNCSVAATVSGNALTVLIKDAGGNTPSATSPCIISFRNATQATGAPTSRSVTAATTVVTGTSGSTFGSVNSVAFHLYVVAIDTGSGVVVGVINASTASAIYPIDEAQLQSSTACNACTNATAAGTFYSTAAQTSKPIRILGRLTWDSGLSTAGTWASTATTAVGMGPGIRKPGEVVKMVLADGGSATTVTSSSYTVTNLNSAIALSSAANLVRSTWNGTIWSNAAATAAAARMHASSNGSSACTTALGSTSYVSGSVTGGITAQGSGVYYSKPNTTNSIAYTVCLLSTDNSSGVQLPYSNSSMTLEEIQG